VIQGLTLKPLLRALDLHDDDPVGRELAAARESFAAEGAPVAELVRRDFTRRLAPRMLTLAVQRISLTARFIVAVVQAAREAILAMRANEEIGDDVFHQVEEESDWLEICSSGSG
jgi:monovalent cation/hydrogen antiporter